MNRKGIRTVALFAALTLAANAGVTAQSEIYKLEAIASYYGAEFNGRPTSSGEIFNMNDYTAAHKTLPFGTRLELTNLDNGKKVIVRVNDRGPFVATRELDVSKAAGEALGMIATGTARVSIRKLAATDTQPTGPVTGTATGSATAIADAKTDTPAVATSGTVITPAGSVTPAASVTPVSAVSSAMPVAPDEKQATPVKTGGIAVTPPAGSAGTEAAIAPAPTPASAQAKVGAPAQTAEKVQWRIQIGSFAREDNATRLVVRLRKDGFNPAFEKSGDITRVVLAGIADTELSVIKTRLGKAGYDGYLVRKEAW
jgi:rare lipoprotein A